MTRVRITRDARLPDDLRVARALSAPHQGPRILFFSGGSALNGISRHLKRYTYNSIHLITPFDSGGSSQALRLAFDMPAVGDLRSRLMALADESVLGQPDIYALFNHRLPRKGAAPALEAEVAHMVAGDHPLLATISRPMRKLIQNFLGSFAENVPKGFDYRHASIGNLVLAGGYLKHGRELEPVLFLMSKMVDVRGVVRAIVDDNLHIGVTLDDGRTIHGQRLMTGKEAPAIDSPIRSCFLSDGKKALKAGSITLPKRNRKLIGQADVICYPPGSLYSSVVANLLPAGVGAAVAARKVPKVYLPSLGTDPEALGHSLVDQVNAILAPLAADAGQSTPPDQLVSHVLCDESVSERSCEMVTRRFEIPCLRAKLCTNDPSSYRPERIAEILVSLD